MLLSDKPQPASLVARSAPGAVLFDLDGTLIDSVPDITAAVAELMAAEGLPPFADDEVRRMVGHGISKLVGRAFAARGIEFDAAGLEAKTEKMISIYSRHLVGRTVLMEGAQAALAYLDGLPSTMAVVTNKLQGATETILAHFGIADRFSLVVGDGGRSGLACKPAPDMLLHALDYLGVAPADAVMVGDSSADIEAAAAAGVFSIAVRGGYATAPIESHDPGLVIDSLTELPSALAEWHLWHRSASPQPT